MRKSKLLMLLISILLVSTFVLSACNGGGSGLYPGTEGEGKVVINLGAEPPKMNSILTTDTVSFSVLRHTNEGLTILDKDDLAQPGMAEKWEISSDKLTYKFFLRDGIKWNDGTPVTANDFKFAWMTLLNPDTAAEYNYMGYIFKNGEAYNTGKAKAEDVAINVIDEKTLEFTLENPTAYVLSLLAFGCFLPVKEEGYSESYATEASNILCNGPYIMKEWNHDNNIILEKNPDYYGADKIKIDTIEMMMIIDASTALNTFQSNEIDMINVNGEQTVLLTEEGQKVEQFNDGGSWSLMFNLENEFTSNKDLREALTLALDREAYIKDVLKLDHEVAFNWTPTFMKLGTKQFLEGVKPTFKDNDIEGAKAALEKAKAALGDDIKIEFLTDDTDNAKLTAAYVQECWKKIGLDVSVATVPFKERLARQSSGEFSVSLYGWGPDFNDPLTFLDIWVSGSGNNKIKLKSEAFDKNIEIARTSPDEKARKDALLACEKELIENFYLGPIYYRMMNYVVSDKLQGLVRTPFQDINLRYATCK